MCECVMCECDYGCIMCVSVCACVQDGGQTARNQQRGRGKSQCDFP